MKSVALVFSLALATGVFAQTVTRSFGSVVFPGGTSSTSAGITRNFGSVVFPGGAPSAPIRGAAPVVGIVPPASVLSPYPMQPVNGLNGGVHGGGNGQNFHHAPQGGGGGRNSRNQTYVYAYPVYVGGGYDSNYLPQDQAPPQQQGQPPQNITVIYPPAQNATPMMIQPGQNGEPATVGQRMGAMIYESPSVPVMEDRPPAPADTHYLIAFKDHIIYSAVAYWVDGETLHYFTNGNTHNQASLSLVDRELTERLNKELGIDFKLSPAK